MLDKIWKPGNFEEVHFFSCIRVWFWIVVKTTIKTVEIIRIACVLFFFFWYLRLYVTYHGWKIWSCGLTPHNNCVNNYVINWKSLIHWHRNLLITSTIITNNLLRIQQGIQPPLRHNLHVIMYTRFHFIHKNGEIHWMPFFNDLGFKPKSVPNLFLISLLL